MTRLEWTRPGTGPSDRATRLDRIEAIRDLFPRCRYCGGSIQFTPLARLELVMDGSRLAHRRCVPEEDVPGQAAWRDAVLR
jgi:hypothetical protein